MRERILEILKQEIPGVDFEVSDTLVEDGVIDSLTISSMIMALSAELGISIPYDEIIEENFNSLDALTMMVERIKGDIQ